MLLVESCSSDPVARLLVHVVRWPVFVGSSFHLLLCREVQVVERTRCLVFVGGSHGIIAVHLTKSESGAWAKLEQVMVLHSLIEGTVQN